MECNKDEAIKAKEIAVRKFMENDLAGAKRFALKAQSLYPTLDGVAQMLTTIDVHISAMKKFNGEMDCYKILDVHPLADDETVKKQYRKLLLQIHPDKNKFVGADTAFQIVTNAFAVLSDNTRRVAYNTRRHNAMAQKGPTQSSGVPMSRPAVPGHDATVEAVFTAVRRAIEKRAVNGFRRKSGPRKKSETSCAPRPPKPPQMPRPRKTPTAPKPPKVPEVQKPSVNAQPVCEKDETFWTVCSNCHTRYEYMKIHLNMTLLCQFCKAGFVAVEKTPPSNHACIQREDIRQGLYSNSRRDISGVPDSSVREIPCNQVTSETRVEGGFVPFGEGPSKKTRKKKDNLVKNNVIANGFAMYNTSADAYREMSSAEVRNMLKEIALVEARTAKIFMDEKAATAKQKDFAIRKKSIVFKPLPEPGSYYASSDDTPTMTMAVSELKMTTLVAETVVPNPEFFIFDDDRLESCFKENQVWAVYDNEDGMPRFYALVHEVISFIPFKLRISWLNSISSTDFGNSYWRGNGITKTCGGFFVSKQQEINTLLNCFSHEVNVNTVALHDTYQVLPRAGDIWTLYKDWPIAWNPIAAFASNNITHDYDLVEVLQDYNDVDGVLVAPILKSPGFSTIFRKQEDPKTVVMHISRQDLQRFSHQVPHHILTGEEHPNLPKGALELDPATLPAKLLQVTTEFASSSATQPRIYP